MLAYACIVMDINFGNNKKKLIQEFNDNIKGLNNGNDFNQNLIYDIIEDIIDEKIVKIIRQEEINLVKK